MVDCVEWAGCADGLDRRDGPSRNGEALKGYHCENGGCKLSIGVVWLRRSYGRLGKSGEKVKLRLSGGSSARANYKKHRRFFFHSKADRQYPLDTRET